MRAPVWSEAHSDCIAAKDSRAGDMMKLANRVSFSIGSLRMRMSFGAHRMSAHRTDAVASAAARRPASRAPSSVLIQRKTSACPCGGGCPSCRAASDLRVGAADDQLERQANAAAARVLQASGADASTAASAGRAEAAPSTLRRSGTSASAASGAPAPASVGSVLGSSGQPLDTASRAYFEPRFGTSFADVRVHAGPDAAQSAREIQARAYTAGSHIAFGAGAFAPSTGEGRELLAHELAHVVQQRAFAASHVQREVEVDAGVNLDTMSYNVTKSGNTYWAPVTVMNSSVFNETVTALFHSDRIFHVKGATDWEASANFLKHVGARIGVIDFAAKKRYDFGAGSSFKMNKKLWDYGGGTWKPKAGVDPQQAYDDLNNNPDPKKAYAISCEVATEITEKGGGKSETTTQKGSDLLDWVPGDWGHIANQCPHPPNGGFEGENIIYVGHDKGFWGHFTDKNTYNSLAGWQAEVAKWGMRFAKAGEVCPPPDPVVDDKRGYPDAGLIP
jgi:hypothetical protein